jgi:hypothetical protein
VAEIVRKLDLGDEPTPRHKDLDRTKQELITELEQLRKERAQLLTEATNQTRRISQFQKEYVALQTQADVYTGPQGSKRYQTTVRFAAPRPLKAMLSLGKHGEVPQPEFADVLAAQVAFVRDTLSQQMVITVSVPLAAFPAWEIKELGQLVNAAVHRNSPEWLVQQIKGKH